MRRSRFSEEQIIAILREQEAGMKVADVCRKHGISDATFYTGRQVRRAGGERGAAAEVAGRREPAAEEAVGGGGAGQRGAEGPAGKKRLTPAARRWAVERLMTDHGFSQRRACRLIGCRPQHGAIPRAGGRMTSGSARPPASAGGGTAAVRLSAAGRAAGARGHAREPQEAVPALSGGAADGAPARRPQAGARHAPADDGAAGGQPALVARLRLRRAQRWPALPHALRGRRLQP